EQGARREGAGDRREAAGRGPGPRAGGERRAGTGLQGRGPARGRDPAAAEEAGRDPVSPIVVAALLALASPAAAAGQAAPAATPKPSPSPASGFEQLSKKAEKAREASQFDEAIRYYKQALQLKPDWIEGHWTLATLLYDQDKYEEARDHFRRVVQA